jgi:hypothetical protein
MNLLSERRLRRALELAGISDYQLSRNKVAGFVLDFVVFADFRSRLVEQKDIARDEPPALLHHDHHGARAMTGLVHRS